MWTARFASRAVAVAMVVCLGGARVPGAYAQNRAQFTGPELDDPQIVLRYTRPGSNGRLTLSASELVFDAGSGGLIRISYEQVSFLQYGRIPNARPTARRYPWSAGGHGPDMVTRTLHVFIGEARASRVSFRLARDSVRPVVQELQRRTGRVVDFDFIEDCVEAKSQEECGYGDPSELKGRSTVFLDVGGSAAEQSRQRIRSVIEAARLGLRFVSTADEGSVILVFSLDQGRCDPPPRGCAPDSAVGEAYVSVSAGLKVVMLFDRERSTAFSPGLAGRFAGDFVKAYKRANGLR